MLREEGISAHGLVVDSDPVTAVRDALAQLEPPVDEIILATHPQQKSGWLRKNVVDRVRESAGNIPGRARRGRHGGGDRRQERPCPRERNGCGPRVAGPDSRAGRARQRELLDHLAAERSHAGRTPGGGAAAQTSSRRAARRRDRRARPGRPSGPVLGCTGRHRRGTSRRDHRVDLRAFAISVAEERTSCSACTTRPSCRSSTSSSSRIRSRKALHA